MQAREGGVVPVDRLVLLVVPDADKEEDLLRGGRRGDLGPAGPRGQWGSKQR